MDKQRAKQLVDLILEVWQNETAIQSYLITGSGKNHEIQLVLPTNRPSLKPIQEIANRHELAMKERNGFLVLYKPD